MRDPGSANELRNYFGVVPQETVLFSGTLYDNLLMANPHATFEQVVQACRMAEIHDVIEALPQGYQTEIEVRKLGSGLALTHPCPLFACVHAEGCLPKAGNWGLTLRYWRANA